MVRSLCRRIRPWRAQKTQKYGYVAEVGLGTVATALQPTLVGKQHLKKYKYNNGVEVFYYGENGQRVEVRSTDINKMTVKEIKALCDNLVKSAQNIKKVDPTNGQMLREYVRDQYKGLENILTFPALTAQEMSIPPGNMEDMVRGAQVVVAHNQAAAKGRAAVESAQQRLLDITSGKPGTPYCHIYGGVCY